EVGASLSRRACIPPLNPRTSPKGNVFHTPRVGLCIGSSIAVQYWTRKSLAYGSAHAMRMLSTGWNCARSITIHCGCDESLSPVHRFERYGLLFHYVFTSSSVNRANALLPV